MYQTMRHFDRLVARPQLRDDLSSFQAPDSIQASIRPEKGAVAMQCLLQCSLRLTDVVVKGEYRLRLQRGQVSCCRHNTLENGSRSQPRAYEVVLRDDAMRREAITNSYVRIAIINPLGSGRRTRRISRNPAALSHFSYTGSL